MEVWIPFKSNFIDIKHVHTADITC